VREVQPGRDEDRIADRHLSDHDREPVEHRRQDRDSERLESGLGPIARQREESVGLEREVEHLVGESEASEVGRRNAPVGQRAAGVGRYGAKERWVSAGPLADESAAIGPPAAG